MRARFVVVAGTSLAILLAGAIARAQEGVAPLADSPGGPPVGPGGADGRALRRLFGALGWFADVQRSGPDVELRASPLRATRSSAPDWLPDERVSVPPGPIRAGPRRWIGIPIVIETTNTQVAGEPGPDAVLLGVQLPFDWP